MTREELNRANDLFDEISKLKTTIRVLDHTIEFEKNGGREKAKRSMDKFLSFLRFNNFKDGINEPEKAHIILFHGVSIHGNELPVDLEMIEEIYRLIQKRLDEKEREFASIGGNKP